MLKLNYFELHFIYLFIFVSFHFSLVCIFFLSGSWIIVGGSGKGGEEEEEGKESKHDLNMMHLDGI